MPSDGLLARVCGYVRLKSLLLLLGLRVNSVLTSHAIEVFASTQQALERMLSQLDTQAFSQAIGLICNCRGLVLFTGVGKTGIIAQKIVATLQSYGVRAMFLHPTEAGHGDSGVIGEGDVLFFLSNSGNTEELLLLEACVNKRVHCCAWVGSSESRLAQRCSDVLVLGKPKEGCPLEKAPMASTTCMLVLGDAVCAEVAVRKSVTIEGFQRAHPYGALGRTKLENL